tara:strand:+ start:170 stop:685 length:516 start_codon:yes stop_codon:yes gene_type:complete
MEVIGYPKYLIYDDGRVWSKGRQELTGHNGGGCLDPPKFRKQYINEEGYHKLGLTNEEGKSFTFSVHRLVALHYIPNPMNYPQVDHKDRNPSNNHYTNLRWCTDAMNSKNKGMYKNNKTGHKGIRKRDSGSYIFQNKYNKITYASSTCKTLSEVLWFKIVFLMRIKYGYYD